MRAYREVWSSTPYVSEPWRDKIVLSPHFVYQKLLHISTNFLGFFYLILKMPGYNSSVRSECRVSRLPHYPWWVGPLKASANNCGYPTTVSGGTRNHTSVKMRHISNRNLNLQHTELPRFLKEMLAIFKGSSILSFLSRHKRGEVEIMFPLYFRSWGLAILSTIRTMRWDST